MFSLTISGEANDSSTNATNAVAVIPVYAVPPAALTFVSFEDEGQRRKNN